MPVAKEDDLFPDGIRIIVDWDLMQVGDSVFVPCINVHELQRQLPPIFERREWGHKFRVACENHILGVRIWRSA
jgi:hypothetical protein